MRRSVTRLVRLKRVERAVLRDEFWVNFRSASPSSGTTRFTSVEHKIITSLSHSCSSLFPSEGIFTPFPFRPIPFHSVSSAYQMIPKRRERTYVLLYEKNTISDPLLAGPCLWFRGQWQLTLILYPISSSRPLTSRSLPLLGGCFAFRLLALSQISHVLGSSPFSLTPTSINGCSY
ncbi:hypothetical protein C1H46_043237 [Malus baccata]|uniref:Uncharacterized protein n=1 Tax=Malus baccata TaxID=106549 RepID=A0A540KAH4_MALBA|nr:hypothetical protein C1H46_043237 [Malus baccata]